MSLTVQTEQRGDMVVVSVAGELDMATAPQLQDQISDLLEKGRTRLVFDLAEVSFCDSTGLSVFVRAKNSTDDAGGVGPAGRPAARGAAHPRGQRPGRGAAHLPDRRRGRDGRGARARLTAALRRRSDQRSLSLTGRGQLLPGEPFRLYAGVTLVHAQRLQRLHHARQRRRPRGRHRHRRRLHRGRHRLHQRFLKPLIQLMGGGTGVERRAPGTVARREVRLRHASSTRSSPSCSPRRCSTSSSSSRSTGWPSGAGAARSRRRRPPARRSSCSPRSATPWCASRSRPGAVNDILGRHQQQDPPPALNCSRKDQPTRHCSNRCSIQCRDGTA